MSAQMKEKKTPQKKESKPKLTMHPKIQTAEGWKREKLKSKKSK